MVQHPPLDILYAVRHGFKAPEKDKPKSLKEAARANPVSIAYIFFKAFC